MELPKVGKGSGGGCSVIGGEDRINAELQREEVEAVLSCRHSARDLALFMGLLFLDVKLNELLNIRRKRVNDYWKKTG